MKEDWSEWMINGQAGPDIPILPLCVGPACVSPGTGLGGFVSADSPSQPNLDVYGVDVYLSAGFGVSVPFVWGAKYAVFSTMDESSHLEYDSDIARMRSDILSGNGSPIWILTARRLAAAWAQTWYEWREGQ